MPTVPSPLSDDITEGRCLPFIGAGFSANASLPDGEVMPTWRDLSQTVAAAGSIEDGDGPSVAQQYERLFGRVGLIDAIRQSLHSDTVRPGRAHSAFAQLPFDTVYTTNFDLLLEDACQQVLRPFRSLVGELQLPFHAGPVATNIVKMHGDLRHEEHMTVTRRDYDDFLSAYPVIATHLSAMLITRTALFVGYSRTDPDFLQILDVVRSRLGRFQRMSYMIQFDATPENMSEALDDQLHIISLDSDHPEGRDGALADFFGEIQNSIDKRASMSLRRRRPDAFEPEATMDSVAAALDQPSGLRVLEGSSHMAFVMMPFTPELDAVYYEGVSPSLEDSGLKALRSDEIASAGIVFEQIRTAIQNARLCVADVTGANPNVMFEVGLAQSMDKPLILIAQDTDSLPFDIASFRIIRYQPSATAELRDTMTRFVQAVLTEGKLEEAEQLISAGMYAATIAVLSVLLEQTLRQQAIEAQGSSSNDELQRMTLRRLVTELHASGSLPSPPNVDLRRAIDIRNSTVHGAEEPTRDDADFMLSIVKRVLAQ